MEAVCYNCGKKESEHFGEEKLCWKELLEPRLAHLRQYGSLRFDPVSKEHPKAVILDRINKSKSY